MQRAREGEVVDTEGGHEEPSAEVKSEGRGVQKKSFESKEENKKGLNELMALVGI